MDVLWNQQFSDVDAAIESSGLKQINDASALEMIVDEILAANPKNVEQYRAGNIKALNALVGQIMKRSQGKANPQQVNELLRRKLD
jgi:aspartyl-tRNA(Asn)/glutamyl-tRNA(Gln) amidotransferase subunit B